MKEYLVIYERAEGNWAAYAPDVPVVLLPARPGLRSSAPFGKPSLFTSRAYARKVCRFPSRPRRPVASPSLDAQCTQYDIGTAAPSCGLHEWPNEEQPRRKLSLPSLMVNGLQRSLGGLGSVAISPSTVSGSGDTMLLSRLRLTQYRRAVGW